jgi:hypothetical protein
MNKRFVNDGSWDVFAPPSSMADDDQRAAELAMLDLGPRHAALQRNYDACLNTLRDIVAIGKGKGYELAKHRLAQLGEPEVEGGG